MLSIKRFIPTPSTEAARGSYNCIEDSMSTIVIDDQTRAALESNAKARGMELSDYLRLLAHADSATPHAAGESAASLADLVTPILDAGTKRPVEPRADRGGFGSDENLINKYRKMGFSL